MNEILETNYSTVVPYEPRADKSFVHEKFRPLNDLTYEKLEEEHDREVSSRRTATPPPPTLTTILPPPTPQGPYLHRTAWIRVADPVDDDFSNLIIASLPASPGYLPYRRTVIS
ncbi:hypothetical protein Tco_0870823 [Tanacetum coccineum]